MASTYVNDLRLEEMATGENSGSWGTKTNTNLELIGEAFGFGTEGITTNADTHASTIADGSTDPVRAMYVKYTGTLDSACTITIGPNTVNKFYYIENATSGSQNIIIKQGSGATITIPAGDTKAVYLDGAGSGAAVVDAFASLSVVDLKVQDDLTVTDDVAIGGLATVGGTLGVTGVVTANAGVVVDNITIDGTEIDLSSGDLTLDVAGDIILDADGGEIFFNDGGTSTGKIRMDDGDLQIRSLISDKNITLEGNDGGSIFAALTLDMSDAGTAIFNHDVLLSDNSELKLGTDGDLKLFCDNSGNYIRSQTSDMDLSFVVNDGGNIITALTIDASAAGAILIGDLNEQTHGARISQTVVSGNSGISVMCRSTTDSHQSELTFLKTPATSGNYTATASGEALGVIQFRGVNTSAVSDIGAQISVVQNGTASGTVPADMIFTTNESERMRIDAAGKATFTGQIVSDPSGSIILDNSSNTPNLNFFESGAQKYVIGESAGVGGGGAGFYDHYAVAGKGLRFFTAAGERLRITTDGNVLVGTTSSTGNGAIAQFVRAGAGAAGYFQVLNNGGVSQNAVDLVSATNAAFTPFRFWVNGYGTTLVGSIVTTTSSTAYNTSSDYRLKENVDYTWDATTRLKQLKPARFNFIADSDTTVDGFIAHEVQSVVPEAVTGEKDAMIAEVLYVEGDELPEGKAVGDVKKAETIDPQGIDQSKLVPLLVKTILELEARITALEA